MVSTDSYDVQAGLDAARAIAATPAGEQPTAVFAINDLIAMGLERGFRTAGLRVPDDVSTVGYDDIPVAETATAALTTIRHPHDEVAREATSLLLEEINALEQGAAHLHRQVRLEPQLIVRESTAKLLSVSVRESARSIRDG